MGLQVQDAILKDSAEQEVLGLVTASPAATTILGRLKTIADALAAALTATISTVTAAALIKAGTVGELITCTAADTDYAAAGAVPAGTRYIKVRFYSGADGVIAVGAATSSTNGYPVGDEVIPFTPTGVAADDTVHVQSPTAGAVCRLCYVP